MKVESRKEENEDKDYENKYENEDEDDYYENKYENKNEDDDDDDETMDQNEIIIKKWSFRWNYWQIKIIWRPNKIIKKVKNLEGYYSITDFGDKELKFKIFKPKLAHLSNEIDEDLFEQIFGQ